MVSSFNHAQNTECEQIEMVRNMFDLTTNMSLTSIHGQNLLNQDNHSI